MFWTTATFCVIALWAMLTAFGGERRRQLNEQEMLEQRQAEQKQPPTNLS